jgi:hypothetical protein
VASVKPRFGDVYTWGVPGEEIRRTVMWIYGPIPAKGGQYATWYGIALDYEQNVSAGWFSIDKPYDGSGLCWTKVEDE